MSMLPPKNLKFFCELCPWQGRGVNKVIKHLKDAHGYDEPERWPDGELVVDASNVPELLVGGDAA